MNGDDAALREAMEGWITELQDRICQALAEVDGAGRFREDRWERPGGGGGRSRVLEGGGVFEKAGVNVSVVHGELEPGFAQALPGAGHHFYACGLSLVVHPESPRIPTVHANVRYLVQGDRRWFGGGMDLTPYYLVEADARHFHRTLAEACAPHHPAFYPRFKAACDAYFHLPHRGEARGVGGVFFDDLTPDAGLDWPALFAFVQSVGEAFLPAYLPIVDRRRADPWGARERGWQLQRRGRYVEFNLVHDRGTLFGLKTGGRTESILMSLPPLVRWDQDATPPGPEEAALMEVLRRPRDWL